MKRLVRAWQADEGGWPTCIVVVALIVVFACVALSGCAGVPLGRHTYVFVGVGVIHTQKGGDAIGIRTRAIGAMLGCGQVTVGLMSLFCVSLPANGSVAILEQGPSTDKHLTVQKLPKETVR